jgi:hypothetical protein
MPKKKKDVLMKEASDIMKVGVTTTVGHGLLGGLSAAPGMPPQAGGVTRLAGAGLTLVNVGQLAKSGLTVAKTLTPSKKKKTKWW